MRTIIALSITLAVMPASLLAPQAHAQDARTVVIADGRVSINGSYLDDDSVPAELRDFEGEVSFTFRGEEDPVLGLGNDLYRIQGDEIVKIPPSSLTKGPNVHVFSNSAPGKMHWLDGLPEFDPSMFSIDIPEMDPHMFDHLRVLSDSMAVLGSRFAEMNAARMRKLAEQIRHSVPPPGGRVQVYRGPHGRDMLGPHDPIRHQLEMENELDVESMRIAGELRQTESETLRAELEEDLRAHLEDIFELRQENRRAEVRELEQRIEELRNRLEKREELRQRIIDERMEFLLEEDAQGRER